jgi:hypothetical protein
MIIFVENAHALVILKLNDQLRKNTGIFIVYEKLIFIGAKEILPEARSIFVSALKIRILKNIISLLQFNMVQPDPLSFAYKINRSKLIISDGLLTEILVNKCIFKTRFLYTIKKNQIVKVETLKENIIIGSNWLEFGSMSLKNYMSHLKFLRNRYPEAIYFKHPRETGSEPEFVFGKQHIEQPKLPIELHCLKNGIPQKIIGVCSTSLLSIPRLAPGCVDVDQIILNDKYFDGPKKTLIYTVKARNQSGEEIHIKQLEEFINLKIREVARNIVQITQN